MKPCKIFYRDLIESVIEEVFDFFSLFFVLKRSVGHLPGNSEVDVPLTYADYYFVEALLRYKTLKGW